MKRVEITYQSGYQSVRFVDHLSEIKLTDDIQKIEVNDETLPKIPKKAGE